MDATFECLIIWTFSADNCLVEYAHPEQLYGFSEVQTILCLAKLAKVEATSSGSRNMILNKKLQLG